MAEEGAVAVCVRLRPLNSREEALAEGGRVHWTTDGNVLRQVDGGRSFGFDRVFDGSETTKNVYEEIAVPIIDSAIQGYNGTIFAYGQTASGKTYTMMGSKDHLGVIPRAIHDIFQKIKKFPDREFLLRVSYMEIYNETITDLLCDTMKMKPLIIREDFNRSVYVSDLTEEVVNTSEMALKFITKGEKNRHYGVTKMNQRSSRSHTIFRMILESREKGEPSNCDGSVKVSHLNLVDLAGSERAAQTGADGVRLKEGCNINRSLFILGQVIKRLSDGQAGGFINYRDSKLTRILQNSLGGNAKTRIICTVTPMSYDETLSTLQFASTAKHMKNTPCVNEVSSDEALLKRYRKEIVDLKKQLEEVSLETRAQAMQKDQLAQLLEEKDLLQKVQNEKIQNLTQMLVTSSSLTSQQELKAKIKRRVTWCPGKINKMKHADFVDGLNVPANVATVTHRVTLSSLGEVDESLCSEADVFSNTLDSLAEVEWNPATKLLSPEALEAELSSLRTNYDNLVLDYEQLQREHQEMGLKLKEKEDLDEFEALEKKVEKDQENELSSKTELLQEKEEQIKRLQSRIDSQNPESTQTELPSNPSGATADLDRMKQSLHDVETVALDSKRESAFLRSENLRLKENLEELSDACRQKERDVQACQKQLEAKKKMQADLEKELQSSYSEVARLSGLLEGRVPRDLLSSMDLERKIAALQKELRREAGEKEGLQQEVDALSVLRPLPSQVERLQRELDGKCEELRAAASEREKLSYDMAERERQIQDLLQQLEETGHGPAAAQSPAPDAQARQHHLGTLEENASTGQEVDTLRSEETQQLEQVVTESREGGLELERLRARVESGACDLQAAQRDKEELAQRLQEALAQVEELRRQQESLRAERDQLRLDIQDMVVTNIDTQEQLRDALECLKQHQQAAGTPKSNASAETPGAVGTVQDEARAQSLDVGAGQNPGSQAAGTEGSEPAVEQRAPSALAQEHAELQQRLDRLTAEKEQLQADLAESIETAVENQEELRLLREELKRQQGKNRSGEREEPPWCPGTLAQAEEELKEKSRQLRESQRQLVHAQEEASQMQRRLEEAETLQRELRAERAEAEAEARARAEELRASAERTEVVTRAREELAARLRETEAEGQLAQEELRAAYTALGEQRETVEELRRQVAEKTAQVLSLQECKERPAVDLGDQVQEHRALEAKTAEQVQAAACELEAAREQFEAQKAALQSMEIEKAQLAQRLKDALEEASQACRDRDSLRGAEQATRAHKDQLEASLREAACRELEQQEELADSRRQLKEQQVALEELRAAIAEKTEQVCGLQRDLESSSVALDAQTCALQEKAWQLLEVENSLRESTQEAQQMKEQLQAATSALESAETERLRLTQELRECLGEAESLAEERASLRWAAETAAAEQDQLRERLQEAEATIQELQASERHGSQERQKAAAEMEQLRRASQDQSSSLSRMEMENLNFAQRLHDSTEELKTVTEERDSLKRAEAALSQERDQLRDSLQETTARELETQRQLKVTQKRLEEHQETIAELRERINASSQPSRVQKDPPGSIELSQGKARKDPQEAEASDKRRLGGGQQPTESLRDKSLRVKELLRKFPESQRRQRCSLDSLSADMEKEIRLQEALSARVREKLSLCFPQAGPAHKLLACSLSCSLEFLRVLEKLQYVLDNITTVKEEHHTALSKLEAACVDEADEQEQLLRSQPPGHSRASWALRLGQKLDLHIQEVGRDVSGNDFQGMRADLEEVLGQRRELTRFLEAWLAAPSEPEQLREHLQRDTDSVRRVNFAYSSRMVAMMSESTLFEQSCSAICREWEQELRTLREEKLRLLRARQEAGTPQPPGGTECGPEASAALPGAGVTHPSLSGDGARPAATRQELEAAREAVARLQRKVDELDRDLATSREENRALQDRVSLGVQPYKEEIEELKMHLVKTDLDRKQQAKEFQKEMASMRASAEHQQGVIRVLKEELRRRSQAQDTSMTSEPPPSDPSPSRTAHKPWTCGGGSGIVQSTKALILRSEYVRLEKENGRLRRQNQQLLRHRGQLSSVGTQHPPEAPDTREQAPQHPAPRERVTDENLGPSARVTARKRPTVSASPCKERSAPAPKPGFSDARTKLLPTYPPTRFLITLAWGYAQNLLPLRTMVSLPYQGPSQLCLNVKCNSPQGTSHGATAPDQSPGGPATLPQPQTSPLEDQPRCRSPRPVPWRTRHGATAPRWPAAAGTTAKGP